MLDDLRVTFGWLPVIAKAMNTTQGEDPALGL